MDTSSQKPPFLIWGLPAFLFISFFLYMYLGGIRGHSPVDRSIAILPFEILGGSEDDQTFSDGMHDDLVSLVSCVEEIKTISRRSVMHYRSPDRDLSAIKQELGAATALECRVQFDDGRIKLRAQLMDTTKDRVIWINLYEREISTEEVFSIQHEILLEIAKSLKTVLSPEMKARARELPTGNLDALTVYYEGKERLFSRAGEDLFKAVDRFEKAIQFDPRFAEVYAFLAVAMLDQIFYHGLNEEVQTGLAELVTAKALELNPNEDVAYRALGLLRQYQRDEAGAASAFKKALKINPNDAESHFLWGSILRDDEQYSAEGILHLKKSVALDPFSFDEEAGVFRRIGQIQSPPAETSVSSPE